jgi:hypothetical protein
MLYDILCDVESGFDEVNLAIPDIGGQSRAPALLPNQGRLVKTHERYLPHYRKAVYLVRDVRDVILSEHRHQQLVGVYMGDFDAFFERFLSGKANAFARWDHHVNGWLDAPINGAGDLLLIRFERMRQEPAETLREVLTFLGLPVNESLIQRAVERNDLRQMQKKEKKSPQGARKNAPAGLKFVNEGQVRGWHERLTPAQINLLNERFGSTIEKLGYDLDS